LLRGVEPAGVAFGALNFPTSLGLPSSDNGFYLNSPQVCTLVLRGLDNMQQAEGIKLIPLQGLLRFGTESRWWFDPKVSE
jgi:hypothetical protein